MTKNIEVMSNVLMLCLDSKISFQILDLDEIYCLDGMEFEIMEFVRILIKSLYYQNLKFKLLSCHLKFSLHAYSNSMNIYILTSLILFLIYISLSFSKPTLFLSPPLNLDFSLLYQTPFTKQWLGNEIQTLNSRFQFHYLK